MNLKRNIIALSLVASTLLSASACSHKNNEEEKNYTHDTSVATTDEIQPEINVVDSLNNSLYDENMDYKAVINNYLSSDYDTRPSLKDDYFRALYMLLLNSGVDMNVYLEELNNMCILGLVPTELPEDLWYQYFGNLIQVSNNYNSLYDMFGEFAQYVHEIDCLEEHTINEYGGYSCSNLEKEYKLVRN